MNYATENKQNPRNDISNTLRFVGWFSHKHMTMNENSFHNEIICSLKYVIYPAFPWLPLKEIRHGFVCP